MRGKPAAMLIIGIIVGLIFGGQIRGTGAASVPCATPPLFATATAGKPTPTHAIHGPKLLSRFLGSNAGNMDEFTAKDGPQFIVRGPFTLWVKASAVNPKVPATGRIYIANPITDQFDFITDSVVLGAGDKPTIYQARITDMDNCKVGCVIRVQGARNLAWDARVLQ